MDRICLLLLSLTTASLAAPTVKELPLPDGSTAGLVLPGQFKGRKTLVVWLHGGIGANDPGKGLKAARNMKEWADTSGFALLCPSAWPASPWPTFDAKSRMERLIAAASKIKRLKDAPVVLAGSSDGGAGALWLAGELRPKLGKRLSAVAVWSCNPSVLGNYGVEFQPRTLAGTKVRWAQGGRDRLFALEDVRQWWNLCLAARVKLEAHPVEMSGHDMADWTADQNAFGAWVRGLR